MPVSYQMLFAEDEPQVIGVDMTRECIEVRYVCVGKLLATAQHKHPSKKSPNLLQLPKGDSEQMAQKRATMRFGDIQGLNFGYRELVKIDNLSGLNRLVKLSLDCNRIAVIESLSHLVRGCAFVEE
jgi:hypothetical protein